MSANGSTAMATEERAGTGVEEGHQMRRGEPTTRLLCARLAEVVTQLRGVGHREAGPIQNEEAVVEPPSVVAVTIGPLPLRRHQGGGHLVQQALQDAEWESLAGGAE